MEMSIVLQVAMFFASLAVVVCVACLIPLAFQARRRAEQLVHHVEDLKTKAELLAHDTQELVSNLKILTQRANHQMDEIGEFVQTVRRWTDRADRIMDEVGSAIEPPVFALARNISLLRIGLGGFNKICSITAKPKQQTRRRVMTDNSTTKKPIGGYVAAITIGALAGAGIALLYAPRSGRETRELIAKRSRALTKLAGDKVNGAKEAVLGKKAEILAAVAAGRTAMLKERARHGG